MTSQRQACGNSLSNDLAKITQVFGKKTRKEHVPGHKCGIELSSLSVLQTELWFVRFLCALGGGSGWGAESLRHILVGMQTVLISL